MAKPGLSLLLFYFVSLSTAAASLDISDAWIKYLPPVVPVRAGYMVISNNNAQQIRVIHIESDVFTKVDIHETVEKDGMMTMRPVMPLTIPAGETFKLAPGGLHLMMMKPAEKLKPGDQISVTLHFGSGDSQLIKMTVKK